MGGIRITNMAQGSVGPIPKILKHGSVNALQRPPLQHSLPISPRDGLGVINPFLKQKQLGASGGQVRLRRGQGDGRGLRAPLCISEPGPEASGPARILRTHELQLQVVPTLQACANLGHPAVDLLLDPGLASPDGIFRLRNLMLPRL